MTRPLSDLAPDAIRTGRLLSKNTRPQNVIYPGLLAASVAFERHASIWRCVACYALLLCLYGVAASLNNAADVKTDTLNHRADNPLVGEFLKRRELSRFVVIALCAAAALQICLRQPYSAIIALVYVVLSYAYSDSRLKLQARGLWGTGALCLCYSTLPFLLGAYQTPLSGHTRAFQIAAWTVIATTPIILAKDYKDLVGDKRTGKITPLVRYGAARLRVLTYSILTLSAAIYVVLSSVYGTSLLVAIPCDVAYVLLTILLHRRQGKLPRAYKSVLLLVMIAMTVSLAHAGLPAH